MNLLCLILEPSICFTQTILNLAWFPLTFFGFTAPVVGDIIGPALGCTF